MRAKMFVSSAKTINDNKEDVLDNSYKINKSGPKV